MHETSLLPVCTLRGHGVGPPERKERKILVTKTKKKILMTKIKTEKKKIMWQKYFREWRARHYCFTYLTESVLMDPVISIMAARPKWNQFILFFLLFQPRDVSPKALFLVEYYFLLFFKPQTAHLTFTWDLSPLAPPSRLRWVFFRS